MKIAITADCHLSEKFPERISVLENIFSKLRQKNIRHLFIAGDLFDKTQQNYSSFDDLIKQYSDVNIYLIPGNHDPNIKQIHFTSQNLRVISSPEIISFDNLDVFMIPYVIGRTTMDEVLAEFNLKSRLPERFILISHGDYISMRNYVPNPYEKGIYMPISVSAIEKFKPLKVFLGHIHKATDEEGKIYYPGSPCPVDITETGKRRFLIFDMETLEVEFVFTETPYIYFNEVQLVYPLENEIEIVEDRLTKMIKEWGLKEDELKKVILKIELKGYSRNKKILAERIKQFLIEKGVKIYNDEPDLSSVSVFEKDVTSQERIKIFEETRKYLQDLNLNELKTKKVGREDIEEQILKLIFGR